MEPAAMRERLTPMARSLRRRETNSEEKLWHELRGRNLDGWKFKRQAPRGPYVVDFLCVDARLVIEIDGIQHNDPKPRMLDARRTHFLKRQVLRVLRFSNSDVLDKIEGVLDEIYRALGEAPAPSPGAWLRARMRKQVR